MMVVGKKLNIVPGTNPVTRFPSGGTSTGGICKTKRGHSSRARHVEVEASCCSRHVVFESPTFEAARPACEIVGSTVSYAAVPVAGPHIGAAVPEPRPAPSAAVHQTAEVAAAAAGLGVAAALAHVPPLEVQVLARPAVPVSRSAHLLFLFSLQN